MTNYLKSFWKYYLLRNPKLILTFILTIFVYFWINKIINSATPNSIQPVMFGQLHEGIYFIFIKPFFVYIAGLVLIHKI